MSERYINNSTGDISLCFSEHLTGRPNNQNQENPLCPLLFWVIEVGTQVGAASLTNQEEPPDIPSGGSLVKADALPCAHLPL